MKIATRESPVTAEKTYLFCSRPPTLPRPGVAGTHADPTGVHVKNNNVIIIIIMIAINARADRRHTISASDTTRTAAVKLTCHYMRSRAIKSRSDRYFINVVVVAPEYECVIITPRVRIIIRRRRCSFTGCFTSFPATNTYNIIKQTSSSTRVSHADYNIFFIIIIVVVVTVYCVVCAATVIAIYYDLPVGDHPHDRVSAYVNGHVEGRKCVSDDDVKYVTR